MALRHNAGGDVSTGGNWLTEPGLYHMMVVDTTETPTKRDGSPISEAICRVSLSVLAGTVDGQKDKGFDLTFWHGKPGDEKSQAFATKKLDRFFLSTGLMTRAEIEQKVSKDIELAHANGRQLVVELEERESNQGKKFLDLKFAEIYHVDDPAVAAVPKDAGALKLIAASLRWPGGKPAGDNGASQSKATAAPAFVEDL
jgi:hypothetical protein